MQSKPAPDTTRLITGATACVVAAASLRTLLAPVFADPSLYGRFDWDAALSLRYAVVVALRRYHELPWYNPWLCGGFPEWGFSQGAENLVSPFLPFYLFLPLTWAFRLEVLGSAVLSVAFTYLAASRFTRSIAVRSAVVAVAGLNGRWAFQIGAGHMWHLQYAWMPLAFYFFDRAIREGRRRHVVLTAATLAIMVYMGAIYPLPHTVLLIGTYALFACFELGSARPIASLALAGVLAIAFSAPKLFPVIEVMRRFPRLVDSREAVGLTDALSMLTIRGQRIDVFPVHVPAYGWHEWGIYVGWAGVVILVFAVLLVRTPREAALGFIGLAFFVSGLGAFSPHAPWVLLHEVTPFSSQHVPSRFFFPSVLALALGAASVLGRWLDSEVSRRRWLDLMVLCPVAWMAGDIAKEARRGLEDVFVLKAPEVAEGERFAHTSSPAYDYSRPEWTGATLLLMQQKLGRMLPLCYGLPKDGEGLARGAIARELARYRGEAYVANGLGAAHVVRWSPSAADVEYHDASNGALVVYNMNWDPSWRADGGAAISYENAVAAPARGSDGVVHFVFFPRGLTLGLVVLASAVAGLGAPGALVRLRERRARAAATHPRA